MILSNLDYVNKLTIKVCHFYKDVMPKYILIIMCNVEVLQ